MQDRRAVDALLAHLPADDPERAKLDKRATTYATDCGCAMGAAFMGGSFVVATVYFAIAGGLGLWGGVSAVAFVLVAALVGKATGLGLASLKLMFLRRSLSRRLRTGRDSAYVHVH